MVPSRSAERGPGGLVARAGRATLPGDVVQETRMVPIASWMAAIGLVAGVLCYPAVAAADVEVDLALVLAVDVSRSMDTDEQQLQREGYVSAFRSTIVHDAIEKGMLGRIAAA